MSADDGGGQMCLDILLVGMRITDPIAYTFPNAQSTPVMSLGPTVVIETNSLGSILPHFPSDAASAVPEGSLPLW